MSTTSRIALPEPGTTPTGRGASKGERVLSLRLLFRGGGAVLRF